MKHKIWIKYFEEIPEEIKEKVSIIDVNDPVLEDFVSYKKATKENLRYLSEVYHELVYLKEEKL